MSRLVRPAAASRATSRSRPVRGSTPEPRARAGVRSPPASSAMSAERRAAAVARRASPVGPVELGQLGGGLGGQPEGVEGLEAVDHVAEGGGVGLDQGAGVGGQDGDEGAVHLGGELVEAVDDGGGLAEADEVVQERGLEDVHLVVAHGPDDVADAPAGRGQVAPAGVEPGVGALAGGRRGGQRAVAHPVGLGEGGGGRLAVAEEQVALGDADVGPHQRGLLARPGRLVGDGGEAPDGLVAPAGVAGDLGERHLEPDPGPQGAVLPRPLGGGLEQLAGLDVAARVGEGVGLVDEVLGDAAAGGPVGQLGVARRRPGGLPLRPPRSGRGRGGWRPGPAPGRRRCGASRPDRPTGVGDAQRLGRAPGAGEGVGLLPLLITEGMRAMSVKVDSVTGVSGFITPNSRVDVLVAGKPEGGGDEDERSKLILQNVRVLATGKSIEQKDEKPVEVPTVTLLVSPEEAEKLTLATRQEPVRLALRNYRDEEVVRTSGHVDDGALRERGPRS